ncbi:MAG: hypothetical protein RDV48_02165 [Candidatus Eremiobacteraeota bacterium]|nr:hypothetical protein [Candidatus Eremiobacteraeota bacterium]
MGSDQAPESKPLKGGAAGRSFPARAGKFFAALVIFLLVLEILLHLGCRLVKGCWYPALRAREYPPLYRKDSEFRWRVLPGLHIPFVTREFSTEIITESSGLRVIGGEGSSSPVLVIGDSFSFGWGVNAGDSFPFLLMKGMARPVISAGVPGFGLEQDERMLGTMLATVKPSLVIVETWPVDWDILNADNMVEVDHYLVTKSTVEHTPRLLVSARIALMRYSPLFGVVDTAGKVIKAMGGKKELLGGYGLDAFISGEQPELIRDARRRAFQALRNMHSQARAHGIPLVVVVVPSSFQIYGGDLPQWTRAYGISGAPDLERPNRELAAFAEKEGIVLVDLLEAFKASREGGRLYYVMDPHWNKKGHALAAEVIEKFIAGKGLVKAPR